MKLGILGTGMIVNDLLTTIDKLNFESVEILGTPRSREKTIELYEKYNMKAYYFDYDEMLKSDIDTVYVALPNHLHFEFAKKALLNNKNVIIEKPITSNSSELKELIKIAEEKNLIIIEAVNIHYLPAFKEIKKNISKVGNPKIVSLNYSQYSSRYDAFKNGTILPAFDYKKSGGALMDINVYNINFIVSLFGKPKSINYSANIEKQIDTSGILTMDYGNFKAVAIGAKDCKAPTVSIIHLPFVLQRKDEFEVKTIYRRNPAHDSWDYIDGVHYTDNMEELLNDDEIDMIVVCTPHDSHFKFAKMVLDHNKHCLVEKPFMETSAQAKEIFEYAASKGLYISAYQNRRFDSDFLTVQKVIESGKLGDLLEVEMHYDYYRAYVPENTHEFKPEMSYLYGHGCHTIDQVISYFGKPDKIHYDVRQLLGEGRMNDYFDLDLYYGILKVSVKSSYFRIKERPSFVLYGKKGMFVKEIKDRQEECLKMFYMPDNEDFGKDRPQDYGTITYYDENGDYHEEKVKTVDGDYAGVYDGIYEAIVNHKEKVIKDEETILQMEILEEGIKGLK